MNTNQDTYKLSNWDYKLDSISPMKFSIKQSPEIKCPDILMKYFKLSEYSVDSIINKYFYASHPADLNDPFECFNNLLDYSDTPLDVYIRFFTEWTDAKESYIRELFYSNIDKLNLFFTSQLYDFLFSKSGIISMTTNFLDMLMWAHYSNHNGFLIIYNVSLLKSLYHGPFPINYVENAQTFKVILNPQLSLLYLTNIKSKCWSYENEWRIIAESTSPMKLPNRTDLVGLKDRKIHYPENILKEVVLGYNFFDFKLTVQHQDDYIIYDLKDTNDSDLRIKLLEYLIVNDILVSMIYLLNSLDFKLTKRDIILRKFEPTKFGYKIKHVA